MASVKKLTPNQQQWKKEINRINRFQREAGKRGFEFSADSTPPMPKRVTAQALKKLKTLTPAEQYKTATYVDPMTGDVMTGMEGRALERSRASKKGWKTKKYKPEPPNRPQPPPTPDPPTMSPWDNLMDRINEIDAVAYGDGVGIDYSQEVSELRAIHYATTLKFYEVEGGFRFLDDYTIEHDSEFQECLDIIAFASSQDQIQGAFAKLAVLLNVQVPLKLEQMQRLEEQYGDFADVNN